MPTNNTITVWNETFEVIIDSDQIQERVQTLGAQICKQYAGKQPLFLVVLNGAFMFAADLLKQIDLCCEISFVKISSYEDKSSTGTIKQLIGLQDTLSGRDVIIVEDIVDTGLTMQWLVAQVTSKGAKSVRIATLLHKPDCLKVPIDLDYVGFSIENRFVVGYGLDYDGLARNSNCIYALPHH